MTRPGEREEAALWSRWRALARKTDRSAGAEPDEMTLAAYADGRLDARRAEAVEAWLFDHPDALADVLAARALATAHAEVPEALLGRACALVASQQNRVLPFPQSTLRSGSWRGVMAWASIAASLLITSLVGLSLTGHAQYEAASRPVSAALPDLLDPPGGLFSGFDEDPAT